MLYGIFSYGIASPRVGVRHKDFVLDLDVVSLLGYFDNLSVDSAVFAQPALNDLIALGKQTHRAIRQRLNELLENDTALLIDVHDQVFIHESRVTLHLPVRIGDYTDFYAGIHHAENVGHMFRPQADPLLPNYKQLPVGYHGRASSIVVSGTPIRRPSGQFMENNQLTFGPSKSLDFELELALIIGKENTLGESIPVDKAEDYIFGVALFNDWSARDIQRWEYQPLGPFLGKNFASSLAAWVLPFDELEPFRVTGIPQDPMPLPYLQTHTPGHFDLELAVSLRTTDGETICISRSNTKYLYWTFAQLIAHHTVGGCNLRIGDLLATGTISGDSPGSYGSLLELSWNGERPLHLSHTTARTFLADGDTVMLQGHGFRNGVRVDLGEVSGTII